MTRYTRLAYVVEGCQETVARIFISYRREDSLPYAGRLYDDLCDHFGSDAAFMDIDTIPPGVDFVRVIENAISASDVVIALIGQQWLSCTETDGRRRLDHTADFVRLELAAALRRDVVLIPVLVHGAAMPRAPELPRPLVQLARRNAFEISDARWRHDVGRLIRVIEEHISARPHELVDDLAGSQPSETARAPNQDRPEYPRVPGSSVPTREVQPPVESRSGGPSARRDQSPNASTPLSNQYDELLRTIEANDWQRAVILCNQVLQEDPFYRDVYELLSRCREELRKQRERELWVAELLELARRATEANQHPEALAALAQIAQLTPELPESAAAPLQSPIAEADALRERIGRIMEIQQVLEDARHAQHARAYARVIELAAHLLDLDPENREAPVLRARAEDGARREAQDLAARGQDPEATEILEPVASARYPGAAEVLGIAREPQRPGSSRGAVPAIPPVPAGHSVFPLALLIAGAAVAMLVAVVTVAPQVMGLFAPGGQLSPTHPSATAGVVEVAPAPPPGPTETTGTAVAAEPCADRAGRIAAASDALAGGAAEAAREFLASLATECPGPDLDARLANITAYRDAQAAMAEGDWNAARLVLRELQKSDTAFPGLDDALFTSLLGASREAVGVGSWVQAQDLCSEAGTMRPNDAQVVQCRAEAEPPTPTLVPTLPATRTPVPPPRPTPLPPRAQSTSESAVPLPTQPQSIQPPVRPELTPVRDPALPPQPTAPLPTQPRPSSTPRPPI